MELSIMPMQRAGMAAIRTISTLAIVFGRLDAVPAESIRIRG